MTVVSEKQRRGYLIVCKTRHYILPMSWQLPGPFLNSPVFARRELQIVRQTEEENFWEVFTEGIFLNNRWAPWSNWQYSWPNGSIPKGGGVQEQTMEKNYLQGTEVCENWCEQSQGTVWLKMSYLPCQFLRCVCWAHDRWNVYAHS